MIYTFPNLKIPVPEIDNMWVDNDVKNDTKRICNHGAS